MGNLGAYQWITTISKKVGGPLVFLGVVAATGYAVFRGVEAGGKQIYKLVKKQKTGTSEKVVKAEIYKVTTEGTSNEGIVFMVGDEICVLEVDGDAVLIDKIGDKNSPYFISKELLDKLVETKKEGK